MTTEDRNDLVVEILYKLRDSSTGDSYWAYDLVIDLMVNDKVLEQYNEEMKEGD